MTNTFDPATHRFGMAYRSGINGVVYPFHVKRDSTLGHYFEFSVGGRVHGEYCSRMERAPEHDLIPRAEVDQLRQSHTELLSALKQSNRILQKQGHSNDELMDKIDQAIANAEKVQK